MRRREFITLLGGAASIRVHVVDARERLIGILFVQAPSQRALLPSRAAAPWVYGSLGSASQ